MIIAADRPLEVQAPHRKPLPAGAEQPEVANAEYSRVTFSDLHFGHFRSRSASSMRLSVSNCAPQLMQRYSYIGMRLSRFILQRKVTALRRMP